MARSSRVAAFVLALCLAGCRSAPVQRTGAAQKVIVERTYPVSAAALRESALDAFTARSARLRPPFKGMTATPLQPPFFGFDWLENVVDPGEFLKPYKQIPASARRNDLLLQEATGDVYWNSEYSNASGPVKFRCEFILHFVDSARGGATVQVFEKVPSVWPGMYWTFGHSGPGWYRDIRFVEPTVKDRLDALEMLAALGGR